MKKFASFALAFLLVLAMCPTFVSAKAPVNLALLEGASIDNSPAYKTTYNGNLLDGVVGTSEYDNKWAGFYYNTDAEGNENEDNNYDGEKGVFTLDLGKCYANIDSVEAHIWDAQGVSGIASPSAITVYASVDNVNFTKLGNLAFGSETIDWAVLSLDTAINARYIKYEFYHAPKTGVFMFVSEVAVYGDGTEAVITEPAEDTVINLIPSDANVEIFNISADDISYSFGEDGSLVVTGVSSWPHILLTYDEAIKLPVATGYIELEAKIEGASGATGSIRLEGPDTTADTDDIYLHQFQPGISLNGGGDGDAGSVISYKIPLSDMGFVDYRSDAVPPYAGVVPFDSDEVTISGMSVWAVSGATVTVTKLNLVIPGTPAAIPETITIDGVLDDNGWASDGWTAVDETNGVIQEAPGDTPLSPVAYKYQLRTDDEYLYFGAELNCDAAEGGNGVGTNVRFWIKSNDEATVYTHFYDVFLKDGAVATNSKYNTSATENSGAAIENPSIVAEMKTSDGKTYVEFKVLLSEFTTGNFEYFIAVSNVKDGVNTCLFYPAIAISDEEGQRLANFPYRLWYTEGAAECDIEAVKLGTTSPVQRPTDDKLVNVVLGKKYTWTEGAVRTGGYGDHNEDGTCKYRLTDGAWSVTGFDELVAGYQNGYNEITFNLGEEREIWGIKTDLTSGGWGIDVNGGLIELKISDDGENWTSVASKEINTEELTFAIDNGDGSGVYVFNLEAKGQSAKYVKVCYSTSGHIWASELEVYALKVADKPDTSLMGDESEDAAFTVEITGPETWTEIGEELTFNVKITATGETSKGFSMFSFNIYFNDELALIDDYDLAASITKCPNDSEWKGDDTFYAVEHDEETGYSYVKCAIMTTKETTLQTDDTIEFTITFKTTSAASEYVSLQIPHSETVGVDYDMNQYLGIGDSAAVLEYVEQEESGDDSSSGELGDSGIYAIAVVALVAMIGTAVVIKKRARA